MSYSVWTLLLVFSDPPCSVFAEFQDGLCRFIQEAVTNAPQPWASPLCLAERPLLLASHTSFLPYLCCRHSVSSIGDFLPTSPETQILGWGFGTLVDSFPQGSSTSIYAWLSPSCLRNSYFLPLFASLQVFTEMFILIFFSKGMHAYYCRKNK